MGLLHEMRAVASYLKEHEPGSKTALTNPLKPFSNLWVVRHQNTQSRQISGGIIETARELQVVYYHESEEAAMTRMDAFLGLVENQPTIHILDSNRVQLTQLSLSSPIKTDGGLFAQLGVLKTISRAKTSEARKYGVEPPIGAVHISFLNKGD